MSGIRVTYSGLISFLGGLTTVFTGIIFTLIVTRTLTPTEFGTWGLISGLIIYAVMLAPIISYWATRETARGIESGKTAILATGIFSIIGIFVYVIIAYFIGQQTNTDQDILLFASILIPAMFLNSLFTAINLGWKPHAIGYGTLFFGGTQIAMALVFVYFLEMGTAGVILANAVAHLASSVILIIYARDKIRNSIKKEFFKRWLKLFWLPLYPGVAVMIAGLDVVIFTIITGSVVGLAFWVAAMTLPSIITHSGLISRAVYSKLLEGGNREYLQGNITQLFYFAILFATLAITFAKPGLFALNPLYEIAVPVVMFLAIYAFFNVLNNAFLSFLTGIEKVDVNEKSTFKDYIKSKLFSLPTIRLIQYAVYVALLSTGLLLLVSESYSQLQLLIYWSIIAVAAEIPLTIYLYGLIRKNFTLTLDFHSIIKYLIVSIGVFGMIYVMTEQFLDYDNNVFKFLPNLLLFVGLGIAGYLFITYVVDSKTRKLFRAILEEIKGKSF